MARTGSISTCCDAGWAWHIKLIHGLLQVAALLEDKGLTPGPASSTPSVAEAAARALSSLASLELDAGPERQPCLMPPRQTCSHSLGRACGGHCAVAQPLAAGRHRC